MGQDRRAKSARVLPITSYFKRFVSTLKLSDLKGLEPKSERCLKEAGIQTQKSLKRLVLLELLLNLRRNAAQSQA